MINKLNITTDIMRVSIPNVIEGNKHFISNIFVADMSTKNLQKIDMGFWINSAAKVKSSSPFTDTKRLKIAIIENLK